MGDNTKMSLGRCGLPQDRDRRRAFANKIVNLQVSKKVANFLAE
jgi:hypothetical protein